MDFLVG